MTSKLFFRFGLVSAAAAFTVTSGTQAVGQPYSSRTFERFEPAEVEVEKDVNGIAAQKVLYAYGACLARYRRHQIEAFLEQFPFSPGAATAARKMVTDQCLLRGELSFNTEAIRGPIYQALYRMEFRRGDGADLKETPQIDYASGVTASPNATTTAVVNLRRFGDCTVRNDTAAARALAFSEVDSAAEIDAFARLMPAMGGCVVQGDKIKFTRPLLRGVLAETLYRLSQANARGLAMMGEK